jgi:hypothetical protein
MKNNRFLLILFILMLLASGKAIAQESSAGEAHLTKEEAIAKISEADFVRRRIRDLFDWNSGYDFSKINRAKLAPSIKNISVTPIRVPPDNRTILEIKAEVDNPGGIINITGVRADLSSLGRLGNMMLVDNGLWGDEVANDGIYTIQTNVSERAGIGDKEITVAAANKKGWLALTRTNILVDKNPEIIWVSCDPEAVPADGETQAIIEVKVKNTGRIEDISRVLIDLSPIGGSPAEFMRNDGTQGDRKKGDDIFTIVTVVSPQVAAGRKSLTVQVENYIGGITWGEVKLEVVK